jgi:hypothetical protein
MSVDVLISVLMYRCVQLCVYSKTISPSCNTVFTRPFSHNTVILLNLPCAALSYPKYKFIETAQLIVHIMTIKIIETVEIKIFCY